MAKSLNTPLLVCLLLAAAVFGAFAPALRNGFVGYDDPDYVVDNIHVRSGLTPRNASWAMTAAHANNWHPLTWMSHALDASIFGLAPTGHHLTSILLHVANTLLLFLWLYGATSRLGCSAFVALGFGLHPLHVESVAWVAERKDVLSTFFWLLALLAYTAYARRPGLARYLLVALMLALGLMSKQMLVTLPLVLLLLDWWPLGRGLSLRLVLEKLPLLALSGLAGVVTLWAQRAGGALASTDLLTLDLRLSNAALSYLRYLGKTVWPDSLSVIYPFPAAGIAAWKVGASLAVLAAISVVVIAARRRAPWLAVGWAWYVVTLLPVIGIVQVGMQAMADRYMYVPMIGLLIAVAWQIAETFHGRWVPVVAAGLLLACGVATWRQVHVWRDGLSLFEHAVAVTQNNFVAHDNLGVELDRRGRAEEALAQYRETLRIRPGDRHGTRNYALANFDKGQRLLAAGRLDEAWTALQEGLRYQPDHAAAHMYLGLILNARGKHEAALPELRLAIAMDSALAAAHMGLGVAYSTLGRTGEARLQFEQTVLLDPANVEAHYDLGLMQAGEGDNAGALEQFDAAVRVQPGFGAAHLAASMTLYSMGRFQEAWSALQKAKEAKAEIPPAFAVELNTRVSR
ncbi:MAG: tetratricopeptide repeat protein [Candidatus Solibacter sp.]